MQVQHAVARDARQILWDQPERENNAQVDVQIRDGGFARCRCRYDHVDRFGVCHRRVAKTRR